MDKKFCDYCGQEIQKNIWFDLTGIEKEMDWGMELSRGRITTCSYKCMEEWINRRRRHVTKFTTESTVEYKNAEIGNVDIDECTQEKDAFDRYLVVKSEVWLAKNLRTTYNQKTQF